MEMLMEVCQNPQAVMMMLEMLDQMDQQEQAANERAFFSASC